MTEIDVQEKLMQARVDLVLSHPYFAMPTYKLVMTESRAFQKMATDGKRLFYNPDYVLGADPDQLVTALAHEGLHPMLLHNFRVAGRDVGTANEAADQVVNNILKAAGFEPVPDWKCDPEFDGMGFEDVYDVLSHRRGKKNPGKDGDPGGQGNQGQGGGGQDGQGGQDNKGQGKGNQPGDQAGDQPGSGQDQPWNFGEVLPYPGTDPDDREQDAPSPSELAQVEQEWKAVLAQATTLSKGQGKLPLGADRLISQVMSPRVTWREELEEFFDQFARDDYSWQHPNRRYLASGFFLPSLRSEVAGEIVLLMDASGSVPKGYLESFGSEVSSILEEFPGVSVHVVWFDHRVHNSEFFTPEDMPIKLHPKGGGGTNFIPPMEWIHENDIQPMAAVYMTDLACSSFPEDPDFPVLWVVPKRHREQPVPFGRVIIMNEEM